MSPVLDSLDSYRQAGLLAASDVHLAAALCRLCGEHRPDVALAAALAARAPRFAHAAADLADVAGLAIETEIGLDWPDPAAWLEQVATSPLLDGEEPPLVLDGSLLYLHRYRRYELDVAAALADRASHGTEVDPPDDDAHRHVQRVLDTLLTGDGSDRQRQAVEVALRGRLTVLLGGPGTGKTTTVAALLACLAVTEPGLRVALVAPTGKASARLGEAVRQAATRLPDEWSRLLDGAETATVHRLLGVRAGGGVAFHHDHRHPLPHDVVIVDETSMVSLPLMAHLLEALRPDARLVLVGDPDQLVSVETGTVLGDIAGPTTGESSPPLGPLSSALCVLTISRRFPPGSSIDRLARAIRLGDADAALAVLRAGDEHLEWDPRPADDAEARRKVLAQAADAALGLVRHAEAGTGDEALATLERFRLLCAHREGPFGVEWWNRAVEAHLRTEGVDVTGWYAGRPVLVSSNDYANGLFNGDLGVVVREGSRHLVWFPTTDGVRRLGPAMLQDVETVHATTIHKSQGSEFDHVIVVAPPAGSPLATRELMYTAITRARQKVTVVGDEAAVRWAIERRVRRVGGLRTAWWGPDRP